MSIKQGEATENRAQKYDLIQTKYIGDYHKFKGTEGEAYFNPISNSWHYRISENDLFIEVSPKELECSSDKGWLKGTYVGAKNIFREGKAFWNTEVGMWHYKPREGNREFYVHEGNFVPRRDRDVI